MSLLQRVERAQQIAEKASGGAMVPVMAPAPPPAPTAAQLAGREDLLRQVRLRLQAEIISAFDSILDATPEAIREKISGMVDRVIELHGFAVTGNERQKLIIEMANDVTGFGPLEPLLKDETITEVMVNGPSHVYIERGGKIERIDSVFLNDEHVLRIIERIITPLGRRIDESSPRVDARLPDGSRVNAIIEPLSLVGPVITVRKFAAKPFTVDDLIGFGTATPAMFDFLRACVEAKLNLFVSGGTGSGKTTTLNVISSFIPNDERIVTIEDAAELQLRQEHVITLESRPPNLEGQGAVTIRDLVKNSLRMRPDRIVVGECRAGEALDMLQAMNTGHDGSMTTLHANSARDALARLETLVLMAGMDLPVRAIREQIASGVHIILQQTRFADGSRRVTSITEVTGIDNDQVQLQDVFYFKQDGFDAKGKVVGRHVPTGYIPRFYERLRQRGLPVDLTIFQSEEA